MALAVCAALGTLALLAGFASWVAGLFDYAEERRAHELHAILTDRATWHDGEWDDA